MPPGKYGLLRRFAPRKKVPAKLLILFATNKRNARVALGTFIHQGRPQGRYQTRNDVERSRHNSAFSRHPSPEVCKFIGPQKERGRTRPSREGAGKTGCALHPRSHVQRQLEKTHMSIQVQRKQSGLPCAMVLTAYIVLSPVSRLVCHRRCAGICLRNLTPASGCQDHTTSPYACATLVSRSFRVHRSPLQRQ